MFFKRKISVSTYCATRLDLLFSREQADRWLELKHSWPDPAIVGIDDNLYLTHLRSAHIELLLMVITKKYMPNLDICTQASTFIEKYLDDHNALMIKNLIDLYHRALASSPIDGVLAMAQALAYHICQSQCSQETIHALGGQLYGAVESYRSDFKEVKLT
jgi:hypothetical protein